MANILYIADPNSVHDIKWINRISENKKNYVYLLTRTHQLSAFKKGNRNLSNNVQLLGELHEFSLRHFLSTFWELIKLRGVIRKYKIEVMHIMYAQPNALWILVKYFTKIKVIITTRGSDILIDIPKFFVNPSIINNTLRYFYKTAINQADYITCTSEKQINSIHYLFGRRENVLLIRTGIDVSEFNKDSQHYFPKQLNDKKFVLFPRNMTPLYNHELCLEAIALMSDSIKVKYSFVFVDKSSTDRDYVQKIMANMSNIKADFYFLDRCCQFEMFELCKKSSLVVMTPFSDGTPNSALEAMLANVPVIIPPLDYDNDLFYSCYKLNKYDAQELSDLMTKLLSTLNKTDSSKIVYDKANLEKSIFELENLYA